jgi:hypothetical protein
MPEVVLMSFDSSMDSTPLLPSAFQYKVKKLSLSIHIIVYSKRNIPYDELLVRLVGSIIKESTYKHFEWIQ